MKKFSFLSNLNPLFRLFSLVLMLGAQTSPKHLFLALTTLGWLCPCGLCPWLPVTSPCISHGTRPCQQHGSCWGVSLGEQSLRGAGGVFLHR